MATFDFKSFERGLIDRQLQEYQTGGNVDRKLVIKQRMAALEKELALLERFPKDNFPNLTVIRFDKVFGDSFMDTDTHPYSYAAIKVDGHWYLTGGARPPERMTWSDLTAWMGDHVSEVWLMKDGDRIVSPLDDGQQALETDADKSELQ